jgi:hypothetical protein
LSYEIIISFNTKILNGAATVNCKEVESLITAAVDGELDAVLMADFLDSLKNCQECLAAYEAELSTKQFLQARLKKVKAPQSLVDAIKRQTIGNPKSSSLQFNAVANSFTQSPPSIAIPKWKQTLYALLYINPNLNSRSTPIFAMALSVSILAMIVFAVFMRERNNCLVDDAALKAEFAEQSNIFEMTVLAFQKPNDATDIKTADVQVIANHISKCLGIHAAVPLMKDFKVSSTRLAALGEMNVDEIRFTHNVNPKVQVAVYLFKACDASTLHYISPEVMNYISVDGRNFFEKTCPNGNQVVIWQWGETIYAATTDANQIQLAKTISNPHWTAAN